jgi:subtilisin family serine protease
MFTRKIGLLALVLSAVSMSAHAERYLVQFKSAQTFKNVVQNMKTADASGNTKGMKLLGANATVGKALEHINMLVIDTNDAAAVASLKKHPAIALVEKEIFHPAPKPMATWGNQIQAQHISSARMETPWGIGAVKAPEAWTTTKGETARVMVLDTGLDKDHVAIASRLEKGKNFTTADVNDISDTVGHGTHVSGTILADGKNGGLTGVAPEAKLLMGKICSEMGCSSVAIASGLDWAVEEKVDVVNMSLGGMFMSNGEAEALQRAEDAGVMVVAASGNGGTGMVSYPAAFKTVLAVGAVDSTLKKADFSQWGPELAIMGPGVDVISSVPRGTGRGATLMVDLQDGKGLSEVKSMPFVGSPVVPAASNEVVYAGLGKPEDFAAINVRGKFALISRGEIAFKDKVANAIQAGAVGAVIYNNAPGLLQGALSEDGSEAAIPAAMIEQTVGEAAKALLDAGQSVTVTMSIDATDYASFQGTSMATPHVAGVAALVRAANKSLTPAQVRDVLKNTATPLGPNDNNEYGRGMVNAEAAVAQAVQGVAFRLAN